MIKRFLPAIRDFKRLRFLMTDKTSVKTLYFENFIQNDKMIKYLFDQDIVITVKFFNE